MENKLDLILKELQKIFNQIDEKFAKIDTKFEQIDKRFEQVDKRFDKIENSINNLSTEICALNRTFFKFEVKSQKNFKVLFDSDETHTDKELLFENQLYRLNDRLDNTTFRVSVLEDTAVQS